MEFNSKIEENEFWKDRAENYHNELLMVQDEFHNYELNSKELEQELELQLDDYEAKNKNLIILNEKLNMECETIQFKLSETTKSFNIQIIELQDELTRVKCDKFTLQKYIRELEQTNDDLERSQRATVTSLQDFEQKLNIALEKNAILENELDEKEVLVETVQRLKDEARDLRQDLQVKDLHMNQFQNNMSQQDKDALATSLIEERDEPQMYHSTVAMQTDLYVEANYSMFNGNVESNIPLNHRSPYGPLGFAKNSGPQSAPLQMSLTPAARLSALDLVSDMLRKVGTIELKLSLAAQRGLQDGRLSENLAMNGFSNHLEADSLDSFSSTTPVASPVRHRAGFDTLPRPMSQTVGE